MNTLMGRLMENKPGEFVPCPQCGNLTMKPLRDWRARCSTCGLDIRLETLAERYKGYAIIGGVTCLGIGLLLSAL